MEQKLLAFEIKELGRIHGPKGTKSDETRCCDNTICPPEDGHVIARNTSRIVM